MNSRINLKDGTMKEGDSDNILDTTYRIVISRHDDPDIELTGHYWEIVEFNKVGEVKRLI
jgi:hypothetical protein